MSVVGLLKPLADNEKMVKVEYWKICEIFLDTFNKYAEAKLCGWVTKEARDMNKQPVIEERYVFSGNDYDFDYEQPLLRQFYQKIKRERCLDPNCVETYPDFSDAKDV